MFIKACTMPTTVPRNPIIGAPPAIVARIGRPFSSFDTSRLPTFSIELFTSLSGRPIRSIPFSTIRAIGVLVERQSWIAAEIFPSKICSRIRFMKFTSTAEALRIAQNRSKKINTATPPKINKGHIRKPPARKSSPNLIVWAACSVAAAAAAVAAATGSVACNKIIISTNCYFKF